MQNLASHKRILIPIDLSENSLNVLPIVEKLASGNDVETHILSVNVTQVAMAHAAGSGVPSSVQSDTNQDVLERLKTSIGSSLNNKGSRFAVVEGHDAADAIVEYANEHDIDLIVMTTHGYSGLTRVLLGSVAESVMRRARVSVLTFKA